MKDRMDMTSLDMVSENIARIAELFPNCVTETAEGKKIDFDQLKQELDNDIVEGVAERYRLDWPGKKEAILTANLPTNNTLRPEREESVDFDTTKNLYIEGDNLEALKILQESYLNKVKMIYIDPPYNTGKDFVYRDNFTQDSKEWKEEQELDEEGNRLLVNPESSGRYHSDWLSMMYPRLKLARNLLTDDGVIFISIDDNEVHNLRKVCDEIFGEGNFITIFTRKGSGGRQDSRNYAIIHEYVLCYTKNINLFESGKMAKEGDNYPFYDDEKKAYYKTQLLRKWGENSKRSDRPNLYYSITDPDGNEHFPTLSDGQESCWRWGQETMQSGIKNGRVEFKKRNEKWIAYEKIFEPTNPEENTKLHTTIIDDIGNKTGASLVKELFNEKLFNYPKPVDLIKRIISFSKLSSYDIILDFFAGSSTTAHAVMQLNAEDGGNRKFIMVQLPEETDEKSEAYKAGYKNIAEIGKERIRRAGKKIKEETGADIDYGFRVYKLDSSNMKDVYYRPNDVEQSQIDLFEENVKDGRTDEDLVAQVMLDWGLPLSLPIEQMMIENKKVYAVAGDSLYCCFDKGVDESFAKEVAKHKPLRIVFRDSGFSSDTSKENVKQLLKQLSPETEMKVL